MLIMHFLMRLIRPTEKQKQIKNMETRKQLFHGKKGGELLY